MTEQKKGANSMNTENEQWQAPSTIWLQVEEGDPITWCEDHIHESDIQYERVSERKGFANPIDLLETSVAEGGDSTKERLAAYAHEAWSGWMKYMFSKCVESEDGLLIPGELVNRWKRQAETKYGDLPENEKASDRKEAAVMKKIFLDEYALVVE